jgi:hypothetical protein
VRQRISLVVVTCIALLIPAAAASANSKQFTTFEAPAELLSGSPDSTLDELQALGVTAIRIQMPWGAVAPNADSKTAPHFNQTDPNAYPQANWARYDAAIDGARQRGMRVMLTLTGGAPKWATAKKRDTITSPSTTAFGKFATAAGRRYGKKISWWTVWNEPNLGKLLAPLYSGHKLASPTIYRNLYLKAYSGLHAAGVKAPIFIGEMAPRANSNHTTGTIAPVAFLRSVLCLDRNYKKSSKCGKVPTQGVAMHPYTTQQGPRFVPPNKDDVTIGVVSRLIKAVDRAAKAGALPSHLPIYVTEFGVQSFPDHLQGVSPALQSDYRSIGEYLMYANPRVASFSQYLMRDDATVKGAYGKFESGLRYFAGDKKKPSYDSFRTPLVVNKTKSASRVSLWGLVRPAHKRTTVTIQYADKHRGWKTLGRQSTNSAGYLKKTVSTKAGRVWRLQWKDAGGHTFTGPKTAAH